MEEIWTFGLIGLIFIIVIFSNNKKKMSTEELIKKQKKIEEKHNSLNPRHNFNDEEECVALNMEIYEISKELKMRE